MYTNMKYVHCLIFLLLSVSIFNITSALMEDEESGEVCCEPRFVDSLKSCENFENVNLNLESLILGFQNVDGKGGLSVSGSINLQMEIDDDYEVDLSVSKLTDLGKEYVWGASTNLCHSLKDKEVPWGPMYTSMNISSCPIAMGKYEFTNVILDLNFAKNVMTESFCDEYEAELKFIKLLELKSCHIFSIEIYEKS